MELKNFTENDKPTTLKCSFCHKNIHQNVKKFTYIATLLPLDEKAIFNDYMLDIQISPFMKVKNGATCKNLLQYTTWLKIIKILIIL